MEKKNALRIAVIIISISSCMIVANAIGEHSGSEPLEVLYAQAQGGDSIAQQKHAKLLNDLTVKAEQGDREAQHRLGYYYSFSPQVNGSKVDYVKGAEWFTKSAEQGHAQAQFYLGYFHLGGMGVDKNLSKGLEWFTKSASLGDENTQYLLGMLYLVGDLDRTVNDNAAAFKPVIYEATEQGYKYAQLAVGMFYLMNREDMRNMGDATKGFEWLKKSAEQGNTHSQHIIGMCYEKGVGVAKDIGEANKWYAKAMGRQADGTEEIAETESFKGTTTQEAVEELFPPPATFGDTNTVIEGETQHYYWHYVFVGFFATIAVVGAILAWRCLRRKQT